MKRGAYGATGQWRKSPPGSRSGWTSTTIAASIKRWTMKCLGAAIVPEQRKETREP